MGPSWHKWAKIVVKLNKVLNVQDGLSGHQHRSVDISFPLSTHLNTVPTCIHRE